MSIKVFDFYCKSCNRTYECFVVDDSPQFCLNCGALMQKIAASPAMIIGNFYSKKPSLRKK